MHTQATQITRSDIEQYKHVIGAAVARVCRKVPQGLVSRQDLEAAGMSGLVDALGRKDRFPEEKFEWYARVRVRGAIMDELRRRDPLSRRMRARVRKDREQGVAGAGSLFVSLDSQALEQIPGDPEEQSPLQLVERGSDRMALSRAIDQLRDRDGAILRMHYFQSLRFDQIAEAMQVTPARISQLHTRALRELRALLSDSKAA